MKKITLLSTFIVFFGLSSYAHSDECTPNAIGFNVCDYAKKIQEEAAPQLPMTLNRNLSANRIIAVGPTVTFVAVWTMDVDCR